MRKLSLMLALVAVLSTAFLGLYTFGTESLPAPLATTATPDITITLPTDSVVYDAYRFLTSPEKVGGTLGLAAGLTQVAARLFQTPLGNVAGMWRLVWVGVFTTISTILGAMVTGSPFVMALFSTPVLFSLQLTAHQVMKQREKMVEDKADLNSVPGR